MRWMRSGTVNKAVEAMIRAIICDLDRTLLRTDKTISDHTLQVLRACRAQGILLMAATARPARAIEAYQKQVCFDAAVTLNGAALTLPDRSEFIGIDREQAYAILKRLSRIKDAVISVETGDGIFANVDIPEWQPRVYLDLTAAPLPDALYKILVSSESEDLREILPSILPADTYFTVANETLYQIMNIRATKWNGVKDMLRAFHLDPAEAIYFGDDQDDIDPIRCCGTGVAMKNAIRAVIEAADCVTGSNDEDGVAAYISANILR